MTKEHQFHDELRRPAVTQVHMDFLDELRKSGVTNMWGAVPYLQGEFGMGKISARWVLAEWMERRSRDPDGDE